MKTILLVDDDQALIESQVRAFAAHRHQFQVLTANNGMEACNVLNNHPVDVLITDLNMPIMDGFELLAHVLQSHTSTAVIVMGDAGTQSLAKSLEAAGSTEYVTKPLTPYTLVDKVRTVFARRARGHISGISLASFLQLLHIDRRSCSLTIRSGTLRGTLDIFDGEIMSATCNGQQGEDAAYKILSWSYPDIEMSGAVHTVQREIGVSMPHLLIEAARMQDESARHRPMPGRWSEGSLDRPEPRSSFKLSGVRREILTEAFNDLLILDGAVGVALIDIRSGACVLSKSRDLADDFDRRAGSLGTLVRTRLQILERSQSDEEIEALTVLLSRHVELFCPLGDLAHMILYFLGERSRVDQKEAAALLQSVPRRLRQQASAAG